MAILDKLLTIIGDMTNKLDEIAEEGYDLSNWRTQFIVMHALQIQSQAMIGLCMRLLSNMGLSAQGYRDAIKKLRERGMIEKEEEELLLRMIGFRDIVVHGYAKIDLNTADRIIREREYRKVLRIAQNLRDRARQYWDPTPM